MWELETANRCPARSWKLLSAPLAGRNEQARINITCIRRAGKRVKWVFMDISDREL